MSAEPYAVGGLPRLQDVVPRHAFKRDLRAVLLPLDVPHVVDTSSGDERRLPIHRLIGVVRDKDVAAEAGIPVAHRRDLNGHTG